MSIKGQSFNGGTDGALVNFDVGNAANIFTGGFTIVGLVKSASTNRGILGGYSDTVGSTYEGALFYSDNSGARLFSIGDFTAGFPDPGTVGSPGLADSVWRWVAVSKPAGSAHYRMHYADLATLTWVHGESASASDHGDNDPVVVFSTWAIYAMGFDSGDTAAIAGFDSALSDGAIEAALTQAFADLVAASPAIGWIMPEADVGSAGSIVDFTGGGGDEIFRQLIATSDDPADYDFTLPGTDATVNASTIAAVAAFASASKSTGSTVSPSAIVASAAFPSATKSGGATVAPAVVHATAALPSVGVRTGSTVSPAVVAAVAALPGAAASAGATVTAGVIAGVAAMPAVSITSTGDATVNPATIAARAAFPEARVSSGVTASVRLGGVLVQTSLRGVVRHNGSSVAFG